MKPLENDESEGTKVRIESNNSTLAEFYLGKYDVDVGRGGRAAYIRFGNTFQVWMVRADFIDMSLRPQNWTYSSLWNLRFGRLKSFNNNTNLNRTAVLVKDLLNTEFIGQEEKKAEKGQKILDLQLNAENDVVVNIEFLKKNENIYADFKNFENVSDNNLQIFVDAADKCYYKIDKKDFEEIDNVVRSAEKRER